MAYQITYEWQRERELSGKTRPSAGMWLGVFVIVTALAVRLLMPQTSQVFRELLHPLTDAYTVSALGEMIERIGEGTPVEEAVAVFCRDIIEYGQ